ncbi:hypothetical protein J2S78_003231 [Salibacterium salarium]|nr:hypothetical protein [Salibacterium salarium]
MLGAVPKVFKKQLLRSAFLFRGVLRVDEDSPVHNNPKKQI